jgi:hypothetical protein
MSLRETQLIESHPLDDDALDGGPVEPTTAIGQGKDLAMGGYGSRGI